MHNEDHHQNKTIRRSARILTTTIPGHLLPPVEGLATTLKPPENLPRWAPSYRKTKNPVKFQPAFVTFAKMLFSILGYI